jgi:hypothetical protein
MNDGVRMASTHCIEEGRIRQQHVAKTYAHLCSPVRVPPSFLVALHCARGGTVPPRNSCARNSFVNIIRSTISCTHFVAKTRIREISGEKTQMT